MKRLRHYVVETLGELKKAIKYFPDEMLISTGHPYNSLLL